MLKLLVPKWWKTWPFKTSKTSHMDHGSSSGGWSPTPTAWNNKWLKVWSIYQNRQMALTCFLPSAYPPMCIPTLPKFNSSPLKSYRDPIGKACLPLPPFFRGKLAVKLREVYMSIWKIPEVQAYSKICSDVCQLLPLEPGNGVKDAQNQWWNTIRLLLFDL